MDILTTLDLLKIFFKKASATSIQGLSGNGDSVTIRFQMDGGVNNIRKIEIELDRKFFIKHSKEFFRIDLDSGSPYKPLRDNQKGFPKNDKDFQNQI